MPPRSPLITQDSVYESFPTLQLHEKKATVRYCSVSKSSAEPSLPLGIILDLDGTLITESDDPDALTGDILRPGAVDFLRWCKARGHSLALWTAGHASWAHYLAWKLCTAVHDNDTLQQHDRQSCCGSTCRHTFDFVWSMERLSVRKRIPVTVHGETVGCRWCEQYRHTCDRCECHKYIFACPCRSTKDLNKVWKSTNPETSAFRNRQRTILIENTPQQCIRNYGNAVYVPTYHGNADVEAQDPIFQRMKALIQEMEQAKDIRLVDRCPHGKAAHACFEQTWWKQAAEDVCNPVQRSDDLICRAGRDSGETWGKKSLIN